MEKSIEKLYDPQPFKVNAKKTKLILCGKMNFSNENNTYIYHKMYLLINLFI